MADGSARGGAIPMRSLRLVPYWSVHETLGVDAHNAPLKMRTRRIHLSRAVAWSCVRRHPVAGAALGSTDVEGSDPPVRGPGTGVGPCVFSHAGPCPRGSLPVQRSLAGRLSDTTERDGSGLRLSALAGQVGRLGTRRGPGGAKRQPRLSSRASIGDPVADMRIAGEPPAEGREPVVRLRRRAARAVVAVRLSSGAGLTVRRG